MLQTCQVLFGEGDRPQSLPIGPAYNKAISFRGVTR